jgi:hypothetical protein
MHFTVLAEISKIAWHIQQFQLNLRKRFQNVPSSKIRHNHSMMMFLRRCNSTMPRMTKFRRRKIHSKKSKGHSMFLFRRSDNIWFWVSWIGVIFAFILEKVAKIKKGNVLDWTLINSLIVFCTFLLEFDLNFGFFAGKMEFLRLELTGILHLSNHI